MKRVVERLGAGRVWFIRALCAAAMVLALISILGVWASEARADSSLKVCGSGNGHGVGLSQYGAKGRAEAGQGYARILKTYYRGISLESYDSEPKVRVLLEEKSPSGAHDVRVRSGRQAQFRNMDTGGTVKIDAGTYRVSYLEDRDLYRVTDVSEGERVGTYTGPIRFEPVSGGPLGYGNTDYRGFLLVQQTESKLYLINRLPLEGYLRGVVANEMPSSWAKEALKSQAVAARTYSLSNQQSGPFDFYDDTRDQVYRGVSSETESTNRAVSATAGVYAAYNGSPITAFFHSADGGYTEDSSFVFSDRPYLQAFEDVDSGGRPFEGEAYADSPWMSWEGEIDPDGSPELGVGSIRSVRVLDRTPSGRAMEVEVRGSEGQKTVSGQYDIRYAFKTTGLTRADGSTRSPGNLPSARVSFGSGCGEVSPGSKPARRSGNEWLLKNSLSGGSADKTFKFGKSTDTPLMGDWNGDGKDTIGVRRGNAFYLRNSNSEGPVDIVFAYGKDSDTPVVGDWDGDGVDTIGVRRGNAFYLRNSFSGRADILFAFGKASDTPLAGDWNGNGRDTIGVRRGNAFYLRNSFSGGADILFAYGKASDIPVVGDWDNEGRDTVGVVRGEGWYLTNTHSGDTDKLFRFGPSDARPLVW